MVMRLAFSVAVNRDPEILLIDEILAVGDAAFQTKCIEKVHEFRNAGKTLLCVSHSNMIRQLCDHAIWLDHGELILSGAVADVAEAYAGRQAAHAECKESLAGNTHRYAGRSRNCRSCCAVRIIRRHGGNSWRSRGSWKRPCRTSKPARSRRSGITPSSSGGCWTLRIAGSCALCSGPAGFWGTGRGAWANYCCILLCIRSI